MSEQKKPTRNSYPQIADQVIAEIEQRKIKGLQTYGVPLQPFNERNSPQDLFEELLDASHYCKQWLIEREEMIKVLKYYASPTLETLTDDKGFKATDLLVKLGEL